MAILQDGDLHRNFPSSLLPSAESNMEVSKRSKELNLESISSFRKSSLRRMITSCVSPSDSAAYSSTQPVVYDLGKGSAESSLLLPSDATPAADLSNLRSRATSFRRFFSPKRQNADKSSTKTSLLRRIMRLGGRRSSTAIYPDQKVNLSDEQKIFVSKLGRDDGAWYSQSFRHGFINLPEELGFIGERNQCTCKLFSYQELLSATSNFSPESMVGKGGSSHVYRGRLPNGKEMAVKILKPSSDVFNEFVREITTVESLHHKNVISLVGFCSEGKHLLLVYEFLPWGSLEVNLHDVRKVSNAFGWLERYKVALGVAEALNYLHNTHDPPVIHRDVKSSNILLSEDFEPKLSDFGLATFGSSASPQITSYNVSGTFGYLAPEYFMQGQISDKVDVYAFGVVLLELLSGRKPISSGCPGGQGSLVVWAKPLLESGKLSRLLDPSVAGNYDCDMVERMILAAIVCIRRSPKLRPNISLVLKLLRGDADAKHWAKQQVGDKALGQASDSEEEALRSNMESHINLALLDLEDDSESEAGSEQSISVEEYLRFRSRRFN